MKKLTLSICALFAMTIAISSCSKKATTVTPTTTTTTTTTPTTTTTTSTAPSTPSPAVGNVDGAFISLITGVTTTTMGYVTAVNTETGLAIFYASTGSTTMVDGGAVSVNTYALEKQSNNSYIKTATIGLGSVTDLDFDTDKSNWSIGGAGSVPAFTYNHTTTFPEFTGTMPDAVTRSSGITVTFTGNVTAADSIIVMVAQGSKSVIRTFAGSAASGTISASDLSGLAVVSDNSAILEVVPYSITMKTQGSKKYAFVKEHAMVKMINIK